MRIVQAPPQEVRVRLDVDRQAAVAAGKTAYGPCMVAIDPSELTEEERAILLTLPVYKGQQTGAEFIGFPAPDSAYGCDTKAKECVEYPKIAEPTMDALRALLAAWGAWLTRQGEIREARERLAQEERNAQVLAMLAQPPAALVDFNGHRFFVVSGPWGDPRLEDRHAAAQAWATRLQAEHTAKLEAERKAAEESKAAKAEARMDILRDVVLKYGSADQRRRLDAREAPLGMLPESEAVELLEAVLFEPFRRTHGFNDYTKIRDEDVFELCGCRNHNEDEKPDYSRHEDAQTATRDEFESLEAVRGALADIPAIGHLATSRAMLRRHEGRWACDHPDHELHIVRRASVLVSVHFSTAGWTLKHEFDVF
jgi:hypothetical protein